MYDDDNLGAEWAELIENADSQMLTPIQRNVLQRDIIIKPIGVASTSNVIQSEEVKKISEEVVSKGVTQVNKISEFLTGKKIDPSLVKNLFAFYGAWAFGSKLKGNVKTIALGMGLWFAYKNKDTLLK